MGVPDPSIVIAAKERGIITEADAAAIIEAARISTPQPPSTEDQRTRLSEDGKLVVASHWLPPVPTGQPVELSSTPVETMESVSAPRQMRIEPVSQIEDDFRVMPSEFNDVVEIRTPSIAVVPCLSLSVPEVSSDPHAHSRESKSRKPSTGKSRFSIPRFLTPKFSSRLTKTVRQTRASVGNLVDKVKTGAVDPREHLLRGRYGSLVYGSASKRQVIFKEDRIGHIASSKYFETFTLLAISFNALWIGVDIELNEAATWLDAHLVFQIADNFFCCFFTFEVVIRFLALSEKAKCLEISFVFDVALVLLMIFETWVLAVWAMTQSNDGSGQGGLRQLSILRLLRLLRLTRMGRLMKMIPELMTLIRGMVAALRSVATTLVFLVSMLWIFGIVFVQVYKDEEENELYPFFSRLGVSMVTLFVQGTLLDDLNVVAGLLREDNMILMVIFFIFVMISSMTLLNMLIGVLTKGVADTASEEKERLSVSEATRTLQEVFHVADLNGDQMISKEEFEVMMSDHAHAAVKALTSLGINEDRLLELSRQIFEDEDAEFEYDSRRSTRRNLAAPSLDRADSFGHSHWVPRELSFAQFIDELILLKPGNSVSVRDVMGLRRHSSAILRTFEQSVTDFRHELDHIVTDYGQQLENQARPSTGQVVSLGNTFEHVVPTSKLSSVPTEMLFEELHFRLQARKQRPWQGFEGMDDTRVLPMP